MITVYTADNCAYCPMVKKYLTMKGVDYEEIDADLDDRQTIQQLTGQSRVPVVVSGTDVSVGYNLPRLAEMV